MTRCAWWAGILLAGRVAAAGDPDLAAAVRRLGAADFKTREAATEALWSAGTNALPVLTEASRSADPEVAMRARRVLADLQAGITPDTPPAMRELMRRYAGGELAEKQAIATDLVGRSAPEYSVLSRLAATETDQATRLEVFGPALEEPFLRLYELVLRDEIDVIGLERVQHAVRLWEAVAPEDLTVPLLLLPRFEKWGQKEPADALFARALQVQQQRCARQPDHAEGHNNLAWLCAIGRRQLELGREHALRAVALSPRSAPYLDTLAELEFQLGRTARARELIKQAIGLEPEFDYLQQQLQRVEQGDRQSYPPEHELTGPLD